MFGVDGSDYWSAGVDGRAERPMLSQCYHIRLRNWNDSLLESMVAYRSAYHWARRPFLSQLIMRPEEAYLLLLVRLIEDRFFFCTSFLFRLSEVLVETRQDNLVDDSLWQMDAISTHFISAPGSAAAAAAALSDRTHRDRRHLY
uniref:Uncharacterized protein n=1 Tax=Setaria digitata TaxID=48799 RepID=A0A915PYD2_9BILA